MEIRLSPEQEQFVNAKVATGAYPSAGEMVREALYLLEERDRSREARLDSLRAEVQRGIDQADQGALVDGEEVFARLRRRSDEAQSRS